MSTYTSIASQTLSSSTASIVFAGIPQNYTDLVLVVNAAATGLDYQQIILNNDTTSSNYSGTYTLGDGSGSSSSRYTGVSGAYWLSGAVQTFTDLSGTINRYNFQNYSNNTNFKTGLVRIDNSGSATAVMIGTWRNTSAITSIKIQFVNGSDFIAGSRFNLYGIAAGSPKATGGLVTNDGTYYYHTFTQSGIFTPSEALSVDYLVVAGGGGTPVFSGGGGGGGYRTSIGGSQLSLTSQNYAVTIGSGGANTGTNGSNSVFASITSTGGGAGGTTDSNGASGGSGGGGGMWSGNGTPALSGGSGNAGSYSPSEGNNGGAGSTSSNSPAGGGGGANASGANGVPGQAGNGGAGAANSISGTSVTYAGGGGGSSYQSVFVTPGTGGAGGGGNGVGSSNTGIGNNGTVNTGGGAGGGGYARGASGGSGIVIVRYTI